MRKRTQKTQKLLEAVSGRYGERSHMLQDTADGKAGGFKNELHLSSLTWSCNESQGLVFLAFGFNLVDCGGLLGGRLDSGDAKLPSKKVCVDGAASCRLCPHHQRRNVTGRSYKLCSGCTTYPPSIVVQLTLTHCAGDDR